MAGYYYPMDDAQEEEQSQFASQFLAQYRQQQALPYSMGSSSNFPAYSLLPTTADQSAQQQVRQVADPQNLMLSQPYQYSTSMLTTPQQQSWTYPSSPPTTYAFPPYQQSMQNSPAQFATIPQTINPATGYLSPALAGVSRPRSESLNPDFFGLDADGIFSRPSRTASNASYASSVSYNTDNSRGGSPSAAEMSRWGTRNADGSWSCSHKGCTSRSTFTRGCDLRKHYKRHTKSLFCRHEGCPQSISGGFSSNKDRARHEQKHRPDVRCDVPDCDRLFSRVDNMKDHVRRVHKRYTSAH